MGDARLIVAPECTNLVEEFGLYRYHEASDLEPISEIPIDRDNHAIKALNVLAVRPVWRD